MFQGSVVSIHIAPAAEETMISVREIQARPGKGLAGDRYFKQAGTFSKPQPDRELTLIEIQYLCGAPRTQRTVSRAINSSSSVGIT